MRTCLLHSKQQRDHARAGAPRRCRRSSEGQAPTCVTTRWHRLGHRRLRLGDAAAFHAAFGRERFVDGARSARGTLERGQLLEGAGRLLGPWFADAYADPERRGWGIAFESPQERSGYDPEVRLRLARLGSPTPPGAPGASRRGTRIRRWRCRRATPSSPPCRARRRGRTMPARWDASRRCAPAGWPGRRLRSRWSPVPRAAARCSRVGM